MQTPGMFKRIASQKSNLRFSLIHLHHLHTSLDVYYFMCRTNRKL
ncbi:hypothetical protein Leryth_006708 [Lithospermum erythrorhizon]|nr:hypothetical protein Leryth_006708 [Lithospermum erythrorhizon]